MENKKIIIDGNAFYEIDLDCIAEKKLQEKRKETIDKRQLFNQEKKSNKILNKK